MERFLMLSLAAAALGGCTAGAVPNTDIGAGPSAISGGDFRQLIAIHATGPQSDLDRLQKAATTAGLPAQQMEGPEGWQLVIAFPPGSDPASIETFIKRLRSTEFATLRFKSAVAPSH